MKDMIHTTNSFRTTDIDKLKVIVTAKVEKIVNRKISKSV
jgi:hypothetical protein